MTHTLLTSRDRTFGAGVRFARAALIAMVGIAATACNLDKALKVDDVDVATPGSTDSKAGLPVLYAGARAEFSLAVGSTDGAVTLPGLLADELRDIDTFPTRIEVDMRNTAVNNGTVQTWFRQMHLARRAAERATAAYLKYDATNPKAAELFALNGLMYVMFAEDFCNGVSYNRFDDAGNVSAWGDPQTGDQSLALALAQFDSALNVAKPTSLESNLAHIGRARALLNLGRFADAATEVANVDVAYQYFVYFSENSTRENNGVYVNTGPVSKRFAVAQVDGGNGLAFRASGWNQTSVTTAEPRGTGDVRVRWYQNSIGQDGVSAAFYTLKYPTRSAKIVLADGIEAKLMIAENQLKTNDATGWLATLNSLRSNATLLGREPYTIPGQPDPTTLAPLVDPGTPSSRLALHYSERAFWLYLSGHRLGDLRRLVRVYQLGAETVFPTGAYTGAAGGTFGADVNFPISIDEQNNGNQNAKQCTDRKA